MASVQEDTLESGEQGEFKKVERHERDKDKSGKNKNVGAATKGKDLSHVPCKFFRLGQCTAGSSCVFSHTVAEPGASKEVCTWFVKGNCKFGHKCALAHILPGQPMSMDRKNKKAAQQQQQQSGSGSGKGDREAKKEQKQSGSGNGQQGGGKSNGKDRTAMSALTSRLAVPSRAPMAISKATMSPSAPAPALRDDDFTFGPMDDVDEENPKQGALEKTEEKTASKATAWRQETVPPSTTAVSATSNHAPISPSKLREVETAEDASDLQSDQRKPSPLPLSTPFPPRGYAKPKGSPALDFGPVGSPPRSSPMSSGGMLPTSPGNLTHTRINGFSPGTSPSRQTAPISATSPFSAPVAQTLFSNYGGDREIPKNNDFSSRGGGIASSLGPTTILGSRAWDFRESSGGDALDDDDIEDFLPSSLNDLLTPAERQRRASRNSGVKPNFEAFHHRHSRSVPAVSLLDHMKNIWSEDAGSNSALSPNASHPFAPSSFTGSDTLSPNHLATSNVSAGFLSGLHMTRPNATQRSVSDTHAVPPVSASVSKPSPLSPRLPFDQPNYNYYPQVPSSQQEDVLSATTALNHLALSPSSRALHSHAPGTSLPQGLAAGYSRIHARPPSIFSALSPPNSAGLDDPQHSPLGGSQLAHRVGMHTGTPPTTPHTAVSLVARRGRSNQPTMASPLAGPVITNDIVDDEPLFEFEMDQT